jgi:hypothetical protein
MICKSSDQCYSRRSCSSIDPDFVGVVALLVPVIVVPVDLAGDVFLDNDFIDFFGDLEICWMLSIFF